MKKSYSESRPNSFVLCSVSFPAVLCAVSVPVLLWYQCDILKVGSVIPEEAQHYRAEFTIKGKTARGFHLLNKGGEKKKTFIYFFPPDFLLEGGVSQTLV